MAGLVLILAWVVLGFAVFFPRLRLAGLYAFYVLIGTSVAIVAVDVISRGR